MNDSEILDRTKRKIDYPNYSIYENFIQKYKDKLKEVLIEQESETYTAETIINYSNRLAQFYIDSGIQPNDTISLLLANSIWFVIATFASFQVGAKVTLINPRLSSREIQFQLADSETKILILDSNFCQMIGQIPKQYTFNAKLVIPSITVDEDLAKCSRNDYVLIDSVIKQEESFRENRSKVTDVAFLLYSGGTTGIAKGVMLTHANVIANAYQFNGWANGIPEEFTGAVLSSLPLCHSFGLQCGLFAPLFRGEKIIILPKFNPIDALSIIQNKRATSFYGVPTMYIALLRQSIEDYDLSSLKTCVSGGSALPKGVHQEFLEKTNVSICEGYGLTECSPVTHNNPYGKVKVGSIGPPLPDTEVKIIDTETQNELAVGEIGEIIIKGPQVMKGYWGKGIESLNVFTPNGWLRTGDLAYKDSEGYYFLVDRSKDVINSGGLKIYPREVEEILYKHSGVSLAAVIPIPDDYFGEVGKAYIVAKEGSELTKEEIIEYCVPQLSKYKIPKEFEFVTELPLSAAGKVLKRELIKRNSS